MTIPIPGFHDPFSSLSHLIGAGIFAVLAVPLLRRGWGDPLRVAALGVFGRAGALAGPGGDRRSAEAEQPATLRPPLGRRMGERLGRCPGRR